MSKYIKIVWNITEEVEINNSASVWKKDTSNLQIDNNLFITILDYWTNLMKIYFELPNWEQEKMWVDWIYESHKACISTSLGSKKSWKTQKGRYIEEGQTTQWRKEKGQKNKQESTKHTHKTKDRATWAPAKLFKRYDESLFSQKPILAIMLRPFGFLGPSDFYVIRFSNFLIMSLHDESYSRNPSCVDI